MGHKNGNYSRQKERGNSASFRTFPAQNEASELVRAVMTMLSPLQGAGRLHLRRDGAGVPGGAGRGVQGGNSTDIWNLGHKLGCKFGKSL